MSDRDALGQRGEAIFVKIVMEFHAGRGAIFRPQFLGDKWPLVDFVVELIGAGAVTPYFFAQVRCTRAGLTRRDRRLKVRVGQGAIAGLAAYPAPTYLVGIDDLTEQAYLVSANGENRTSMSSLATSFPVNHQTRERLWNEVADFWQAYGTLPMVSQFQDPDWR